MARFVGRWSGVVGPRGSRTPRPRWVLGTAMVDSLLDAASHGPAGRRVLLCPTRWSARCFSESTVMGLPAGTAGLIPTEDSHQHYNGVCLSDYLACA